MRIDAVVAEISSYSSGIGKPVSVVEFGEPLTNVSIPYVVVRQELGFFRVTTHMNPGQASALRLYVRKDLSNALEGKTLDDSGSKFTVKVDPENVPDPISNLNDDGTISQERLFSVADRI
jgi:hypothetical protein